MTRAQEIMAAGVVILTPFLSQHGFRYQQGWAGKSSGGDSDSGAFVRGGTSLEVHFRYSLGLVRYHVGKRSLTHDDFMRAQPESRNKNAYPGFSSDPLDGFRHLLHDLEHFGGAFLNPNPVYFLALVDWVEQNPEPTGIERIR